jgi:putative glutamine amidotransferase
MPPVIGVTTRPREVPSSAGTSDAHTLQHSYADAILRAGGLPILLAPVPDPHVPRLLERLDGLVLSGGGDIDPSRYGGKSHDSIYGIDFDRDEFEIELVKSAAAERLPVLAICRGLQVVNVALGGTLIEDIPTEMGSADHTVIGHKVFNGHQHVRLDPSSLVSQVIDAVDVQVNSIHHQAVRALAPGFRAVGWADDGVVEAIEHEDGGWHLLAVQWHPEYLNDADDPASMALFDSIVTNSAARAAVT